MLVSELIVNIFLNLFSLVPDDANVMLTTTATTDSETLITGRSGMVKLLV